MNLNSLSGGIMLAALAGVWLLVFVPSWAASGKDRDARRTQIQNAKQDRKAELLKSSPVLQTAVQARRAKNLKRVSGFSALAFLVAFGWSVTLIVADPLWWVWTSASTAGLAISVGLNRAADKSYEAALTKSTRVSTRMKFGINNVEVAKPQSMDASQAPVVDPRAWASTGVPSQLYRSATGTLETPKFAEVLDFADEIEKREDKSTVGTETASINIDEILRRRRANG
jgi:hypothetical protein